MVWRLLALTCMLIPSVMAAFTIAGGSKEIYGIPESGWTSPKWNWGYAMGTGHDCAAICRRRYATRKDRLNLIQSLTQPQDPPEPADFEEVKLTLALAWQRGRWDGSDGGAGGYGEVLEHMAEAQRYEAEDGSLLLVQDMQSRFELLRPEAQDQRAMEALLDEHGQDVDCARRKCSGLVLKAMGFVENGL